MLLPVKMKMTCLNCDRVFDLTNETEASEFYYGHDCEGK